MTFTFYLQVVASIEDEKPVQSRDLLHPPLAFRPNEQVSFPIRDGLVHDWDLVEKIWSYHLDSSLQVGSEGRPVLLSEKAYVTSKDRQRFVTYLIFTFSCLLENCFRWAELLFEKFKVGGLFLSKDLVLECYACGKTTALVVDCGGSGTVLAPIVDGWVESKGLYRTVVGGQLMDQYYLNLLTKRLQRKPVPRFRVNKTVHTDRDFLVSTTINHSLQDIHPSYDAYMHLEMAREIKEATGKAAHASVHDNEMIFANMPTSPYELPDGTIVDMGYERFQLSELHFNPSLVASIERSELESLGFAVNNEITPAASTTSLPRMMLEAILKCDMETQLLLLNNMIVCGGASAFDGFTERVKNEVESSVRLSSPYAKVRTISNGLSERAHTAWLGGSILGSLGSFHEMWVSKRDYDEYGVGIVDKKCP